jgi:hypothetical protein
MRKQLRGMIGALGGVAPEAETDQIEISNAKGVSYQIDTRNGRIVRLTDNKVLRLVIDWTLPEFRPFQQMMDGMDMINPFQPNLFRTMFCAQILSGVLDVDVPIVVDES